MNDTVAREYRIALHQESPRAVRRLEARKVMRRESNTLALAATKDGFAHSDYFHWLGDLRRGQLRIWGGMLRFIDVSVLRRVPKSVLKLMPKLLDAYIEDAYEGIDPEPSPTATAKAA